MGVDRYATAIVADRDMAIVVEVDLDPGGVTRDNLVHGIVDDLGHHVMHGAIIGAADIHARAEADMFDILELLNGGGVVA